MKKVKYSFRARSPDTGHCSAYLSGIGTRRLRGALSPLLRGAPLSKDAVSRLVGGYVLSSTVDARAGAVTGETPPGHAGVGVADGNPSLSSEDAFLLLLYDLLRSGQIVWRRIDSRNDMPKPKSQLKAA